MSHMYGDPKSSRNHFHEPPSIVARLFGSIQSIPPAILRIWQGPSSRVGVGSKQRGGLLRRLLSLVNILTFVWIIAIYWGERRLFSNSIEACDWRHWESWAPGAQPHRVALVADPQLVDPHTYPGRPWPLSTLTVKYTDLYLKRVYSLIQEELYPDSTIFLGDLFDGGREWSVSGKWDNADKSWRKYGESFWLKEYNRFGKMFFDTFTKAGVAPREGQNRRRRLISTLPGNHDLGFANGVHEEVRARFNAYFGEGNRVDIIGNHSFIQIDGVSLSANDHTKEDNEAIWKPTQEFLDDIKSIQNKAMAEEMRLLYGTESRARYAHTTIETDGLAAAAIPTFRDVNKGQLPTILLSHVPLYRDPGTPCGPHREHWPPTLDGMGKPLEKDDRNAISVSSGYQYQNVLSYDLTKDITTKIGNIKYAFSGDDHDYCEVVHMRYPSGGGGIRETTVKSMSWAMGVRKPGFQILSLWNPINSDGVSTNTGEAAGKETLQSHLCLLPDQLSIFIRYGILLSITVSLLLFRAGHMTTNPAKSAFGGSESPLLPTSREHYEKGESSSSDEDNRIGLSSRARNGSINTNGSYALPNYYTPPNEDDGEEKPVYTIQARKMRGLTLFYVELRWSMVRVASVVLPYYFFLIWNG
ncbi:hypothetical protein EJ08DRAFT_152731 [Tothia fuscella]|uniref:Calcineurin-like phosphoesterase domain-containing protein n=1 Tax=Tothia fuscella TaxID=1048955 RepID=A0A9P4U501_9PEZI|nr:hypothetical protein EJ08DRAFT_152731 [Tothia fuscella]